MFIIITYKEKNKKKREVFPVNQVSIKTDTESISFYSLTNCMLLGSFTLSKIVLKIRSKDEDVAKSILLCQTNES